MKKGMILLIMALLLAVGIVTGIFIGRNTKLNSVSLQPADTVSVSTESIDHRLNINTASAAQLMALPGIGETLAGRIIAYREEVGAFDSLDELLAVHGIGKKTLENIEHLVTVGG